jgi:hypothetical protein
MELLRVIQGKESGTYFGEADIGLLENDFGRV